MNNKLILIAGVIITLVGILLYTKQNTSLLNSKSTKPVEIRIGYIGVVQGLPLYLAQEKGYFKKEGITTKLVKYDAPNLLMDAMVADQIEVCTACATGIAEIVESKKPNVQKAIMLIGAGSSDNTRNDELIVRNDSNINSIADLKGKKVGHLPGPQFQTIAKHIFAVNGLIVGQDVTLVDIAPQLQAQALASKQVDALLTLEPVQTILEQQGMSKELIKGPMIQYVSDPWYGAAVTLNSKFVQTNPDTAKKIVDIFTHSVSDIQSDPATSRQYLVGYTPLKEALAGKVPLPVFKMYNTLNEIDIKALNKFFDIFAKFNVITNKPDAAKLIYSQ